MYHKSMNVHFKLHEMIRDEVIRILLQLFIGLLIKTVIIY